MVNAYTELLFLGSSNSTPEVGGDTASSILNGKYQFDTGWHSLVTMREFGIDPLEVNTLFLTHCHHDHYLALPALFYWRMRMNKRLDTLKILGPKGQIDIVTERAIAFLQETSESIGYPQLVGLSPGDTYNDGNIRVEAHKTIHQVPTLCYRVKDMHTEKVITISGDSAYSEELATIAKDSDALVHEAALGPREEFVKAPRKSLHSTVEDAATIAQMANVKKLFLVHLEEKYSAQAISLAKGIFAGEVYKPKVGSRFVI